LRRCARTRSCGRFRRSSFPAGRAPPWPTSPSDADCSARCRNSHPLGCAPDSSLTLESTQKSIRSLWDVRRSHISGQQGTRSTALSLHPTSTAAPPSEPSAPSAASAAAASPGAASPAASSTPSQLHPSLMHPSPDASPACPTSSSCVHTSPCHHPLPNRDVEELTKYPLLNCASAVATPAAPAAPADTGSAESAAAASAVPDQSGQELSEAEILAKLDRVTVAVRQGRVSHGIPPRADSQSEM
ncbi:unnamed protein product, partial [Closterium sp. NIES-53]